MLQFNRSGFEWSLASSNRAHRLIEATRPVLEHLEVRRHLTADLTVSATRLIFNDVRGGAASTAQRVTLTNTGNSALTFNPGAFSLTGTAASIYQLTSTPAVPTSLNPGQSAEVFVAFNPLSGTTAGVHTAALRLTSNDADTPQLDVELRGLATIGTGGTNEPSLQRVLDVWNIPVNVGDANATTTQLFGTTPLEVLGASDEVTVQSLVKSGDGPVTIDVLAVFGVSSNPGVRFGYYAAGTSDTKQQLFTTPTAQAQSVSVTPTGVTSFDPGSDKFGLYTVWPGFTDNGMQRETYSEDQLNQFENTLLHQRKYRFYVMKNPDGTTVANAYVVAVEEFVNDTRGSYDNQDIVFVVRNVQAAPTGPEIGLENRDGPPRGYGSPSSRRLVFSRIQFPDPTNPNVTKDTGVVRVRNTGTSVLTINNLVITQTRNAAPVAAQFTLNGAPTLPLNIAPGSFVDLTVRFNATSVRLHEGNLAIHTNDASEQVTNVTLGGFWSQVSEGASEPTLSQVTTTFGITTTMVGNGQSLNRGGIVEAIGEEVLSPYWFAADPTQPIYVRQMAAYHTQGNTATLRYHFKGSTSTIALISHNNLEAQSLLPRRSGSTTDPAVSFFSPNVATPIGFRADNEWSDPTLNPQEQPGGNYGHHVRFWPVRDETGSFVPNMYIMAMDYFGINYDFQDNLYLFSNVRPELRPGAPANVNTLASGAGVNVTWNANLEANVVGYNVYRSTQPGSGFTKLNGATPVTGLTFNDASVPPGAVYYYRVTALFAGSVESAPGTFRAFVAPPAPSGLTATPTSSTSASLSWVDVVTETGYEIERSLDNTTWALIGTTSGNVTTFNDTGLSAGLTYFYRVRATNSAGDSPATSTAMITTPIAPVAPSGVVASAVNGAQIDVVWNNVASETGFRVERSLNGSTDWTIVGTTAVDVLSFSDTTVDSATTYFYRVFAVNVAGDSSPSSSASATTPAIAPSVPIGLVATAAGYSTISLLWNDVPNDNGYKIERTLDGVTWTEIGTTARDVASFSATGLLANATYGFRVRATNNAGDSAYSAFASSTTPAFVEQVIDNASSTGVTVIGSWSTITGSANFSGNALSDGNSGKGSKSVRFTPNLPAGTHEVFLRWSAATGRSDTVPVDVIHAGGTTTVVVNQKLQNNQWVSLGTFTFNETGGSVLVRTTGTTGTVIADAARFVNTLTAPVAPTNLLASATGATTVALNWTDASSNESGFKIERQGPGEAAFSLVGIVGAGIGNYTATGLLPSSQYTFRVRAFNVAFDGNPSATALVTTLEAAPVAPSGLTVSAVTSTGVALSWTDNSNNESGFKIERRLASGESWSEVGQVGAGITTFTSTGVSPETGYVFRVLAFNGSGNSATTLEVTTTTRPAAPTGLAASVVGPTQINLSWTDVSGVETSYLLERQAGGEVGFTIFATLSTGTSVYNDTGLSPVTTYTYRLRAVSATIGDSDTVTTAPTSTPADTIPAAPTGAGATAGGASVINLIWTDNSSNETGFRIFRQATGEPGFTLLTTVGANVTSYQDTGLTAQTTYTYQVFSTNSGGDSSTFTSASTTTLVTVPSAPSNLNVGVVSASRLSLSWTDNAASETGFHVYRKAPVDGGFVLLSTVGANVTTYLDTNLAPNTPYQYYVVAINTGGESGPTSTVGATTPVFAEQIIDNADASGVSVTGSWNTISNASSYNGNALSDGNTGKGTKSVTFTPTMPAGTYEVFLRWNSAAGRSNAVPVSVVSTSGTSTVFVNQQTQNNIWVSIGTFTFVENTGSVTISNTGTSGAVIADAVRFLNSAGVPSVPAGVSATPAGAFALNVTWADTSNNETGFKIDRFDSITGTYSVVGSVGAGVTSFQNTGLSPATSYTYRVRSFNASADSVNSTTASGTTGNDAVPTAPTSLGATAVGATQVNLTWIDNSNNETGFKVQRLAPGDIDFITLTTTLSGVTSYSDTGLSGATTYTYRVVATNSGGDSAPTNDALATTADVTPGAPSGLVLTPVSQTRIDLAWVLNSTNETSVLVQRRLSGDVSFTTVATLPAGSVSYSDTGLTVATGYVYRVIAANTTGSSSPTPEQSASTLPGAPAVPTGVVASAGGAYAIGLSWNDVSGETGYKILRQGPGESSPALLTTVGADVTSFNDTAVQPGSSYTYFIVSTNTGGDSASSTGASATTPTAAPVAPSGLAVSVQGATSLTLNWTDNSVNETGFKIERKGPGDADFVEIFVTAANATSFTNTGLAQTSTYLYRVRATNALGDSAYSSTAGGTTHDVAPAAPGSLNGTALSATQINLNWTDLSNNEQGFAIYRKAPGESTYTQIGSTTAGVVTFSNTSGVTPSTLYTYRVRAFNSGGESGDSNTTSAWSGSVPEIVMDNGDATGVTITGSWNVQTGGTPYNGNALIDGNSGKGSKSVRFTPTILATGVYEVFVRYTAASGRADNVPVDVIHADGTTTVTVNQRVSGGTWVSLGQFRLTTGTAGSVLIRNTGTNGAVVADAVRIASVAQGIGAFSNVAASPLAVSESQGAAVNGRMYVFGGFDLFGPIRTSHVYDPQTNAWTQIADLPTLLTHSGTAVVGNDVFFAGGYIGTGVGFNQVFATTAVWRYNVVSNAYTSFTPLPASRGSGGLVHLPTTNRLYFFGGVSVNRADRGEAWSIDLSVNNATWQSIAPMPTPRSHMGYVAYDGKVWAVNGQIGTDQSLVTQSAVSVFDPATNAWTEAAQLSPARSHISASTVVIGNRIVTLGGEFAHTRDVKWVSSYDPVANVWTDLNSLPVDRYSGVAVLLGDFLYYAVGSGASTNFRASVFA